MVLKERWSLVSRFIKSLVNSFHFKYGNMNGRVLG